MKTCRPVGAGRMRTNTAEPEPSSSAASRQGEEPMVPVGRRTASQSVPREPLASGTELPRTTPVSSGLRRELRCGYVGCDFIR